MRLFKPELIPPLPEETPKWPSAQTEIDLEIGAGAGLHAIRYCQSNPDRFLIAIERTTKADRLFSRTRNHPQIQNLLPVRADALHWAAKNIPENSLSRVFILYPNPYPKASQKNLRWVHMPFMGFLKSRLNARGELILATNSPEYANDSQKSLKDDWNFPHVTVVQLPEDSVPRTHFEKKYLARREPCFEVRANLN